MSIKSYSLKIKNFFGNSQKEDNKTSSDIVISKKPAATGLFFIELYISIFSVSDILE